MTRFFPENYRTLFCAHKPLISTMEAAYEEQKYKHTLPISRS